MHVAPGSGACVLTTSLICAVALAALLTATHVGASRHGGCQRDQRCGRERRARERRRGRQPLLLQPAPLDPRLRVAACDRPLNGFLTDTSALRYQTTVGVRCEGSVRWTIYTTVRVETQAPVLVARQCAAAG